MEGQKYKNMTKIPVIKSQNFILRPFRKGDEWSLQKNINNRKIYRTTSGIPYPYTLKDAKKWIAKNLKEEKKKNPQMINFAIEINGEAAGSVGLGSIKDGHKAEISYWLGEKYWNRGIMTEAVRLVTKFGFEKLKLVRIYGRVYIFNPASKKVLEKNGYQSEGILRKDAKKDDKFIDCYLLANVR